MKILIVEDEKRNAQRLERLIHEIAPYYMVEGPLGSVVATVEYLLNNPSPDIIIADIRLTDGLSFDALRQSGTTAPVIFTTAYDEYALKAFKFNSIDYLLKPIDPDELRVAINKVKQHSGLSIFQSSGELKELLESLQKSNFRYRERFLIPGIDGYRSVMVKDINHIVLNDGATIICLNDGRSLPIPLSMDELESQLNPDLFFRANRQYIIHIDSIQTLSNYFNSRIVIRLKGYPGDQIIVSRDKVRDLKAWLNK